MKILFLHIGDMHIKDKNGLNSFQLKKIVDSINVYRNFTKVVIIISGDIANSGEKHQYITAYRFVGQLITGIKQKFSYTGKVEVFCVPGNHDLCHNGSCMDAKKLQEIRNNKSYTKHIEKQYAKQENFFNYSKRNHCFEDDKAFSRKVIKDDIFSIEVNLINSGIFSILEEDKGMHYIPQYCINQLSSPSGADFVITVMHHSPDWYNDTQKNMLETAVYGKSSIVFFGHEHYIAKKTVASEDNAPAFVQAGGCLCINDDWTKSSYYLGLLDTDSMEYSNSKFVWNSSQKQYEPKDQRKSTISSKPSSEKSIKIKESFLNELLLDNKRNISKDFRDYFVFPRIQVEDNNGVLGKQFTSISPFIEELLKNKRNLITGGYNSGKTTLLKTLFLSLSKSYNVIYCDIDNIRGKSADRIIKNCFDDMYGDNNGDYDRFNQTRKEEKIIIIDDIDQIKYKDFVNFVSQIGDKFEYFVFASKHTIDINLLDRMKTMLSVKDIIHRYRIKAFYSDKRYELIKKVVTILLDDSTQINKTTQVLAQSIKAQKRFISLDPDFILKYVDYYCKNIGEAPNNDSGVFSKVFEASLINAISKYQTTKLSVDKIFVLLSKIAHYVHFNKAYPIPDSAVIKIIESYSEVYGDKINTIEAINIMTDSRLIVYDETDDGYRFTNRNCLAFFVARAVNNNYNSTGNDADLKKIVKCACFGINADILLFISYITDNIEVLRYILNTVNEYTKDWKEFNFSENMPDYLKQDKKHIVQNPKRNEKQIEFAREVQAEINGDGSIETIDIYDYSESDVDNFVNQIIRACSLMIVVAKCLPNFEHNMFKQDKDAFVDAIFKLPNKIFYLWANEAGKNVDEIIQFFKEQSNDYYVNKKKVTDDDLLRALQWSSMSLLLELYNIAAFYSAKDNTLQYLDNYDIDDNQTYSLEHLMMLEKQNAHSRFVKTAESLDNKNDDRIFKVLLRRVVRHAMIFMGDMGYKLFQQLQSKFFPAAKDQKAIMAQRVRSRKKSE